MWQSAPGPRLRQAWDWEPGLAGPEEAVPVLGGSSPREETERGLRQHRFRAQVRLFRPDGEGCPSQGCLG